jgi:hypothetical protein
MSKLALALATVLALGPATVGFAGEGSPDLAVPSAAQHYGTLTIAPVAAQAEERGSFRGPSADENARMDRASQKHGD